MSRKEPLALGPVVLAILILEGLRAKGIEPPAGVLLITAVALTAMLGGLRAAVLGTVMALGHGYFFLTRTAQDLSVHVASGTRVRVLLVVLPLVGLLVGLLRKRVDDAVGALGVANDDLKARIAEKNALTDRLAALVESQQRLVEDIALLGDLSAGLQSSEDDAEAARLVSRSLGALFPDCSGTLYLLNDARSAAEPFAAWGSQDPREAFAPDRCWALRQGRLHRASAASRELPCGHPDCARTGTHLCYPLHAKGEVLGLLHVHSLAEDDRVDDLARSVSDHLALGLGNLALRKRLTMQAHRDPLTGLLNRWAMLEVLERELMRANRKNRPLAIILIDVDHFKRFNDTHGHAAGDVALREIGSYVGGFFRGDDVVCRYGGEELVAILPEADVGQAAVRAEALRLGVENLPLELSGQPLPGVTVSVGVASLPIHGTTADELLRRADLALYRAKRNGRNHVELAADAHDSGRFPAVHPGSEEKRGPRVSVSK
ncbi:MAG TPA: sensor domain-containing diguanylate cyclase [Polyangiaceae bacterium]|nr:sensor domain-containing diguanylate cyclase [Polyangiaceae bacterium]